MTQHEALRRDGGNSVNVGASPRLIRPTFECLPKEFFPYSCNAIVVSFAKAFEAGDLDGSVWFPLEKQSLVKDDFESVLENLPPSQAHAFWLVCVEQCSQAEVAELMEIERNHVGVLVHRARLHLRGRLNHLAPKKYAN